MLIEDRGSTGEVDQTESFHPAFARQRLTIEDICSRHIVCGGAVVVLVAKMCNVDKAL
ncbi:hypothetical protein CU098_008086 [Rhizopus stolonifer]|uniref:Uncharacterized protein n=1 Tax=Rhizopus stolonifer TaxID=4846 RepID=A0A367ISQ0_RHIST|nr:hypothetical protein CU098_008086 [Rhizopus stolonifer]